MNTEADKAAVLAVMNAETEAWLKRDLVELGSHWVQSPQARRMATLAHLGTQVQEGWDAINAAFHTMAKQYPESFAENRVRHERLNIVVIGDAAWVTYDQVGEKSEDNFEMVGTQHELKIFQRIAGQWKISCVVVMQRAIDHEVCPMIEINSSKKVLWMNANAHNQIDKHPGLTISGGRLRAINRTYENNLQEAVDWALQNLGSHLPPVPPSRLARPVILGETDDAAPLFCWVLIEDGKILVSFDDGQRVKNRIAIAQGIYNFTTTQTKLAQLLAQGQDLAHAAEALSVSINTVRTHLQRLFDRTGTRSQSALVATLLSAETPTAR